MNTFDTDKNGVLDFNEFVKFCFLLFNELAVMKTDLEMKEETVVAEY